MPTVELSAGPIEYTDSGGSGPVVLLCHGLLMNSSIWSEVVDALKAGVRCVGPTFPVGAHKVPMRPDADLSPAGLARLLGEFLEALDLTEVILVVNDLGYPQALATSGNPRVARLVLTPCEAFTNVPPGLPGKVIAMAARVPGGLWLAAASLGPPRADRLPLAFGWMSRRPIPRPLLLSWIRPALSSRRVRADLRKYVRGATAEWQQATTQGLGAFAGPSLVIWGSSDRVMPPEHAALLAGLLRRSQLVRIEQSRTLMPLDAPLELAEHLRRFAAGDSIAP